MNEVISIPRGFASKNERGMRWVAIWNLRKKKRDNPQVLCRCAKLITVKPKSDGTVKFAHRCGFSAILKLEEYDENKC